VAGEGLLIPREQGDKVSVELLQEAAHVQHIVHVYSTTLCAAVAIGLRQITDSNGRPIDLYSNDYQPLDFAGPAKCAEKPKILVLANGCDVCHIIRLTAATAPDLGEQYLQEGLTHNLGLLVER